LTYKSDKLDARDHILINSTIENASQSLESRAWEIVNETGVMEIWEGIGAKVNPVGSLAMGLMMNHRDIDLHIYSDPFSIEDSFKAAGRLAQVPGIRNMTYINGLDLEDRCLEWHAAYFMADGEEWKMDMIHIRKDSAYVGYFEKVAAGVKAALTKETRHAILAIKQGLTDDENVMGIRIYRAVLEGGVRDIEAFHQWEQAHPMEGIETWMP
jgi:hypothetical protein